MQFCDTIIQWKERFFLQNVSGGKDFTFYVSQNLQCLANSIYKFQMVSAFLISIYTLSKLHLLFCLPALAKNIFKCPSLNHDHSFFMIKNPYCWTNCIHVHVVLRYLVEYNLFLFNVYVITIYFREIGCVLQCTFNAKFYEKHVLMCYLNDNSINCQLTLKEYTCCLENNLLVS